MKTYTLINDHDGNDTIDIEADNLLDAALDAIASLGWTLNSPEGGTDYKTMLAAPELLDLAKRTRDFLGGWEENMPASVTGENQPLSVASIRNAARAAIAKAEGRVS